MSAARIGILTVSDRASRGEYEDRPRLRLTTPSWLTSICWASSALMRM